MLIAPFLLAYVFKTFNSTLLLQIVKVSVQWMCRMTWRTERAWSTGTSHLRRCGRCALVGYKCDETVTGEQSWDKRAVVGGTLKLEDRMWITEGPWLGHHSFGPIFWGHQHIWPSSWATLGCHLNCSWIQDLIMPLPERVIEPVWWVNLCQ